MHGAVRELEPLDSAALRSDRRGARVSDEQASGLRARDPLARRLVATDETASRLLSWTTTGDRVAAEIT